MKKLIIFMLHVLPFSAVAQETSKYGNVYYNEIHEIEGTDYVYAGVRDNDKKGVRNKYMLFINTASGERTQVDFPKDAYVDNVTQVKIDSLDINVMVVAAKTVNLDDDKKGIDWRDPKQLIVLSTDGKKKTQVTDDNYYVDNWKIIRRTGTIVITGFFDNNSNKKYDKGDKSEILTFNLVHMKMSGNM